MIPLNQFTIPIVFGQIIKWWYLNLITSRKYWRLIKRKKKSESREERSKKYKREGFGCKLNGSGSQSQKESQIHPTCGLHVWTHNQHVIAYMVWVAEYAPWYGINREEVRWVGFCIIKIFKIRLQASWIRACITKICSLMLSHNKTYSCICRLLTKYVTAYMIYATRLLLGCKYGYAASYGIFCS